MLKSLLIKNYALLVDVEIALQPGLIVLTGETGAGKSIILHALGTILGERVDSSTLRRGASKAVVEGVFSVEGVRGIGQILEANALPDAADELIIRREIHDTGRSRAFVNDSPVQLSVLQELGDLLVDLHGQHEHQSLLKVSNHLRYLDEFGHLEADVDAVAGAHARLHELLEERRRLRAEEESLREKREFYAFQISEIDKINPSVEEEETLVREEKILHNSEKLFNLTNEFFQVLYENEASVFDQLSRVCEGLEELQSIDERFAEYRGECEQARISVEELAKFLQSYRSNIDFNPQRLEEIQQRLSQFASLKKKYGRSLEEILAYRDDIRRKLDEIGSVGERLENLEKAIAEATRSFSEACLQLSEGRKAVAAKLDEYIPQVLDVLGISGARFEVALNRTEDPEGLVHADGGRFGGTAKGMDAVEFYISTNVGETPRPLAKVASGGEISRIMLALKSVAADRDQVPVLIFDEIDMGISGRIAQAVGRKLHELARHHQIICITHLPQIASMGDHHYLVEKQETAGRTETRIRKLAPEERKQAIARLLAGEEVSDAHLKSAEALLEAQQ